MGMPVIGCHVWGHVYEHDTFFQNFKINFFLWFGFFIKFTQWTCIFIEGDMFLLYKKFEIVRMILNII
jgi:hypothetical protein